MNTRRCCAAAAVKRQIAQAKHQHQRAAGRRGQVFLGHALAGYSACLINPAKCHRHAVNRQRCRLADERAAAAGCGRQDACRDVQQVGGAADGRASAQNHAGGQHIHLAVAIGVTVHNAARSAAYADAGKACCDCFQRDVAAASLQADIAIHAGGGDRLHPGLRHADRPARQQIYRPGAALAGDVCVLQYVARRIQAQMAVAQNHIRIERDV